MASVHFLSDRDNWATPDTLYDRLDQLYRFDLDAAASPDNARCPDYCTIERCGLVTPWEGKRVWCNPPYGRTIGAWIHKAVREADRAILVVMLVPSRTDTRWWHLAIQSARPVFLRGRLTFKGAKSSAPFPSALLIWNA